MGLGAGLFTVGSLSPWCCMNGTGPFAAERTAARSYEYPATGASPAQMVVPSRCDLVVMNPPFDHPADGSFLT